MRYDDVLRSPLDAASSARKSLINMNENFTVFSVDDSEFDRRLLQSALARDYRVESFATAEACLTRLGEDGARADLFLLDVDLPGMDGYSLCRRLREQACGKGAAVIFISALNDLESRMEGFDAGGTDFMAKPINLRELRQKIETAHRLSSERRTLASRVAESETLTSLILSNLDEYVVLIKFLRALNECDSVRGVFAGCSICCAPIDCIRRYNCAWAKSNRRCATTESPALSKST